MHQSTINSIKFCSCRCPIISVTVLLLFQYILVILHLCVSPFKLHVCHSVNVSFECLHNICSLSFLCHTVAIVLLIQIFFCSKTVTVGSWVLSPPPLSFKTAIYNCMQSRLYGDRGVRQFVIVDMPKQFGPFRSK